MRKLSQITGILLMIVFLSAGNQKKVTVWMIGDSTMAYKKPERNPESGWGVALGQLVNKKAIVKNRAASGRSTRSFIAEKRWKAVLDSIQPGDFVIIQFGHNDQKKDSLIHADANTSYREYLGKFIQEARSKGANPVVCTPIVRRHFDGNGMLVDTHGAYLQAVKEVALETKTPLVDMEASTRKMITEMGPENSKALFTMRKNGLDSTHVCNDGARQVALLFVKEAKQKHLKIRKYLK